MLAQMIDFFCFKLFPTISFRQSLSFQMLMDSVCWDDVVWDTNIALFMVAVLQIDTHNILSGGKWGDKNDPLSSFVSLPSDFSDPFIKVNKENNSIYMRTSYSKFKISFGNVLCCLDFGFEFQQFGKFWVISGMSKLLH